MMKINTLPAPTWRWLRMNEGETEFTAGEGGALALTASEGAPVTPGADCAGIAGSAGADFSSLAAGIAPQGYTAAGESTLRFALRAEGATLDRLHLRTEPGGKLTAVVDVTSGPETAAQAGLQVLLNAGAGSEITLVQIFRAGDGVTCVSDVGGLCGADARIRLIQLVLSGRETDLGANILLRGDRSDFTARVGYRAGQDHRIDMNYVVPHEGKRTTCDIQANGVLEGQARKIFRGTIDFRKGAAGAVGSETEDVLLMNDGPVNQTIPLILCSEEDVAGTHGATIGRLSDDLVYYMESRGLPYDTLYQRMALSRLNAVARDIPDGETRRRMETLLNGEPDDE